MFLSSATLVFLSQMWHLSFWKKDLRLRSLKATRFGEEEEELSQRLTCGNDSSFLQIPSIVSSSSLPYSPRHWGQGFSRAGEDGVDDGSRKRKDDSLFPLLLLDFCQTEHFWDDSLGFVSLSCSPHLQQSTFRDSLKQKKMEEIILNLYTCRHAHFKPLNYLRSPSGSTSHKFITSDALWWFMYIWLRVPYCCWHFVWMTNLFYETWENQLSDRVFFKKKNINDQYSQPSDEFNRWNSDSTEVLWNPSPNCFKASFSSQKIANASAFWLFILSKVHVITMELGEKVREWGMSQGLLEQAQWRLNWLTPAELKWEHCPDNGSKICSFFAFLLRKQKKAPGPNWGIWTRSSIRKNISSICALHPFPVWQNILAPLEQHCV